MRSEHNGGASLAAFLLAVSTVTLLFVSPVEGQVGEDCNVTAFPGESGSCPATDSQGDSLLCVGGQCETCERNFIVLLSDCDLQFAGNADQVANCQRDCFDFYVCTSNANCPADWPTCFITTGDTEGYCILECVVTAFPGEPESCPALDDQGNPLMCVSDQCQTCESADIVNQGDCISFAGDEDQIANCLRDCFDLYLCTSNSDCPDDRPTCDFATGFTEGQCRRECEVNALPGDIGSCPVRPEGYILSGPQLCARTNQEAANAVCESCADIATAADCETVLAAPPFNQEADVVANCQRSCFGYYACATNADCPPSLPFCNLPQGATEGECSSNCVVTAWPGEPGSCPVTFDQGGPLLCSSGQCQTCESNAISGLFDCENVFSGDVDQIANCQRDCFDYYACTSNADCPADQPTCFIVVEGYCVSECNITALPGAAGSCPGIPEGYFFFGPQYCARTNQEAPNTICESCAGINTPADCEFLERDQKADVVANCKRSCFDFYACATNADCQDTLPICNAGQCEISIFSPLDGMGGGSSA